VDEHTFIHSTQYKPFNRFFKFAKEKSLPDKKVFIKYCNKKNIDPKFWSNDKVYKDFIEYYDSEYSYVKQLETSIKNLYQISEWLELDDISQIFDELDSDTILELLKRRKISPWLFFNSTKFMEYLETKASSSERNHIQQVTNPKRWRKIFEDNPKKRKNAIELIKEMGL
jgi:hypothetical protein